mmetsp:Transcript_27355/g.20502  ORF Transcript_27355/g.20502 Transcript_27355/m.20502 type:complete len:122 (+) Transcript_27355:488-853(+)
MSCLDCLLLNWYQTFLFLLIHQDLIALYCVFDLWIVLFLHLYTIQRVFFLALLLKILLCIAALDHLKELSLVKGGILLGVPANGKFLMLLGLLFVLERTIVFSITHETPLAFHYCLRLICN